MSRDKLLAASLGVFCVGFLYACGKFPQKEEALTRINMAAALSEPERKKELLRLLKSLSAPRTSEHSATLEFTIAELADRYSLSHDEAIIQAIDEVPLDGGFANSVCGFYSAILSDATLGTRCRNSPAALIAVKRCVGLSISNDEFVRLSKKQR